MCRIFRAGSRSLPSYYPLPTCARVYCACGLRLMDFAGERVIASDEASKGNACGRVVYGKLAPAKAHDTAPLAPVMSPCLSARVFQCRLKMMRGDIFERCASRPVHAAFYRVHRAFARRRIHNARCHAAIAAPHPRTTRTPQHCCCMRETSSSHSMPSAPACAL